MKEINIRTATARDAALIADLSRSTFHETFAAQNTAENMEKFMNGQFSAALLMQEVGVPGNIFLLAFDEGEPVGYVRLRENNNPPELGTANALEIARIYATSNAIGKGVGKALMQECIRIALERKKETIWLGVWEHNQRAIDFYTRWGFTKFAEHEFLLGDDAQTDWLMKKDLIR